MHHAHSPRRAAAVAAAATVLSLLVGVGAASPSEAPAADPESTPRVLRVDAEDAAPAPRWTPEDADEDPASGVVHDGLAETPACTGGYAVEDPGTDRDSGQHASMCTHGPDEAPAGVDVRDKPTVAELREQADDLAGGTVEAGEPTAGSTVPCYDDGTSGKRLQAVYAVAADRPDRYASVAGLVPGYASTADWASADSEPSTLSALCASSTVKASCASPTRPTPPSSRALPRRSFTERREIRIAWMPGAA